MSEYTELVERAELAATSAKASAANTKSDKDTVVSLYNEIKAIIDAGGGTGGSCKFYECTSVGDTTWSGYEWFLTTKVTEPTPIPVTSFTISDSGIDGLDGTFTVDTDAGQVQGKSVYTNGDGKYCWWYKGRKQWCITATINNVSTVYAGAGYPNGATDFGEPWEGWTWYNDLSGNVVNSTIKVTPVTQEQEPVVTKVYKKANDITPGLSWTSVKPVVGKSYSADALIQADYFFADAPYKPLTLTAEEAGSTVALNATGSPVINGLEYRLGTAGAWVSYTCGTSITLANAGDCVQFQNKENSLTLSKQHYVRFALTGSVSSSGSIMSMLNYSDSCSDWCFWGLFKDCKALVSIPEFTATKLAFRCFSSMFENASNLTQAVVFNNALPFGESYSSMFGSTRISSLTLPAETLAENCYNSIADNVPTLTYIKVGFTDWLSGTATAGWVYNVASSGTFVCPEGLSEQRGVSYMPDGWTIVRQ